jgi:hypothetical protein
LKYFEVGSFSILIARGTQTMLVEGSANHLEGAS